MRTASAKEDVHFGDRLRALRKHRELLKQFKEVDRLPDDKKVFIKRVLDALLVREDKGPGVLT